jgi:hypothetical protein
MKNLLIVMLLVTGWSVSSSFMERWQTIKTTTCVRNGSSIVCGIKATPRTIIGKTEPRFILFAR